MKTQTHIDALTALAAEIPDDVTIDSTNRNAVRKFCTALGHAYAGAVGILPLAALRRISHIARVEDSTETVQTFILAEIANAKKAEADLPPAPELVELANVNPAPVTPGAATSPADKAAAVAALVELITSGAPAPAPVMDETRIVELIAQHAPTPPMIHVKTDARPEVKALRRQHYKFPLLLAALAARVPAWLVGPAGTSKTTAAHAAAEALGLAYGAISVGPMTSKGDLFGLVDANGVYRESELVRRAREGGVMLIDEVDAGNPGVMTGLNMILANGSFATPGGMVERHPDFLPVFAANTYGTGASRQYVGRNPLDAATLDRGAFIDWPLDEGLEAAILGISEASPALDLADGGTVTPAEWLAVVRKARAAVAAAGLRHLITPRASIYGAALASQGVGRKHLVQTLIVKGLDDAAAAKVTA